jgi:peptide/nickel transport system substrate-binding protein
MRIASLKTAWRAAAFAAIATVAAPVYAETTLVWPTNYEYRDWDPAATYSIETFVLGNIYETLTFYENGKVQPRLATSWKKSDGGATWTMQLRKGVTFHDGSEFNAEAVRKSVLYTKNEGRGAAFLYEPLS